MELDRIYQHKSELVVKNIGNESVIVPLRNNVAEMDVLYTLNETGVFIWNQIDGKNTGFDIVGLLVEEFSVEEPIAARDVDEILTQMQGKIIEPV